MFYFTLFFYSGTYYSETDIIYYMTLSVNISRRYTMEYQDTVHLLRECDAGTKMGTSAIDEVLEMVEKTPLRDVLTESREHHEKLGNEIQDLLNDYCTEEKEPNIMAKSMSWLKTNMKLTMDASDQTIADLITDGCDMGAKSLYKYLNQYPDANEKSRNICKRLITIEEKLRDDLREFL